MKPSLPALKLAEKILRINWSHHDSPGAEQLAHLIDGFAYELSAKPTEISDQKPKSIEHVKADAEMLRDLAKRVESRKAKVIRVGVSLFTKENFIKIDWGNIK